MQQPPKDVVGARSLCHPNSLCSLEVWPSVQVQVLALWHKRSVELHRDGLGGASGAPDGDAEGHQVDKGMVSVDLMGGCVVG